ncbi:TPA: hypothetical protein ACGUOU_004206 [Vibrio vulnificus]|nr:hypothetical protein [Vibrio vulnificus]
MSTSILYGVIYHPTTPVHDALTSLLHTYQDSRLTLLKIKPIHERLVTQRVIFAAYAQYEEALPLNQPFVFPWGSLCFFKAQSVILMPTLPPRASDSLTAKRRRFRKENNRTLTIKNWKQFIKKKQALASCPCWKGDQNAS